MLVARFPVRALSWLADGRLLRVSSHREGRRRRSPVSLLVGTRTSPWAPPAGPHLHLPAPSLYPPSAITLRVRASHTDSRGTQCASSQKGLCVAGQGRGGTRRVCSRFSNAPALARARRLETFSAHWVKCGLRVQQALSRRSWRGSWRGSWDQRGPSVSHLQGAASPGTSKCVSLPWWQGIRLVSAASLDGSEAPAPPSSPAEAAKGLCGSLGTADGTHVTFAAIVTKAGGPPDPPEVRADPHQVPVLAASPCGGLALQLPALARPGPKDGCWQVPRKPQEAQKAGLRGRHQAGAQTGT